MKTKIKIFSFFILLLILHTTSQNIISIPFTFQVPTSPQYKKLSDNIGYFFENYNPLFFINIGEKFKIRASFSDTNNNVYILNKILNECYSTYIYNQSSTYNEYTDITPSIKTTTYFISGGVFANETIKLYNNFYSDSKNYNEPNFVIEDINMQNKKNIETGECPIYYLGLKNDELLQFDLSFIKQLNEKNIIKNYIWNFYFYDKNSSSKYDGSLILGDVPHNYYSKLFNKDNYITNYMSIQKNQYSFSPYGIKLDKIYYLLGGKLKNFTNIQTSFNIESYLMIGTYEYQDEIESDYFNKYIRNKTCKLVQFVYSSETYDSYICNKTIMTEKELSKFPELIFQSSDYNNKTFIFDYKDLFTEYMDYYVFNIFFCNYDYPLFEDENIVWSIGLLFLKKYYLTFDSDSKILGLYDLKNDEKDKSSSDDKKSENIGNNSGMILTIILIIGISLIFIALIIFGVKLFLKTKKNIGTRKKRTDEVDDDDYEYLPENNEKGNNNSNTIN